MLIAKQCLVGGEIWLDPTENETTHAYGSVIYACMPAIDVVTNVWQTGQMSAGQTFQVRRWYGTFAPPD